jgi:hypothetical protein
MSELVFQVIGRILDTRSLSILILYWFIKIFIQIITYPVTNGLDLFVLTWKKHWRLLFVQKASCKTMHTRFWLFWF